MNQRVRHRIGAIVIFLSSSIYFFLAYEGFRAQNIDHHQLFKFNGTIEETGIKRREPDREGSEVFYLKLSGLQETLGIYRMSHDYLDLLKALQPGSTVKVYFESHPKDLVNIDLVQVEMDGKIIVESSEYKQKQASLIFIGLGIGILSIIASLLYARKYWNYQPKKT